MGRANLGRGGQEVCHDANAKKKEGWEKDGVSSMNFSSYLAKVLL
jgi:hypothetical protein